MPEASQADNNFLAGDGDHIRRLLQSADCPVPHGDIELRETHISWVLLCGEFAYKIKKPVDFGFLDFSSVDLRRHYCEEELRLNRRFAPELYLAVVPVTRTAQGLALEGNGEVIDHAVKMRRFDENQLLDNIAAGGGLDLPLLRALARELARLHDELPVCRPDPTGSEPGTPAALLAAIEQNFTQAEAYPLPAPERQALDQVRAWSLRRYRELLPVLLRRVDEGRIIDGHGDAHLGNIALVDGAVRLFDCIEFNPAFRILDGIGEIALLSMDMEARGHHGAAHRLLSDYLEYCGDYPGLELLDLYCAYFAMVRAKVSLLRESPDCPDLAASAAYPEFRRYLDMARGYSDERARYLVITHGVSGTGKSTIAGKLVEAGGAVRIRSDVERKRLFGLAPEQRCPEEQTDTLYGKDMNRATFERLESLAAEILASGNAVIVDATFLRRRGRDSFRALAEKLQVPFAIVDCRASGTELRERLSERDRRGGDASDAGIAVMEAQLAGLEPPSGEELPLTLAAESGEDAAALWRSLRRLCGL